MLREMPSALWQEWQMYADMEPFGGAGDDARQRWALQWHALIQGRTDRGEQPFPESTFAAPWEPRPPRVRVSAVAAIRAKQAEWRDLLNGFTADPAVRGG